MLEQCNKLCPAVLEFPSLAVSKLYSRKVKVNYVRYLTSHNMFTQIREHYGPILMGLYAVLRELFPFFCLQGECGAGQGALKEHQKQPGRNFSVDCFPCSFYGAMYHPSEIREVQKRITHHTEPSWSHGVAFHPSCATVRAPAPLEELFPILFLGTWVSRLGAGEKEATLWGGLFSQL